MINGRSVRSPQKPASFIMQSLIALLGAIGAAGCASAATPPKSALSAERTRLAAGVELVVSEHAGPEARRIAEEIHEKYSSELITARPANAKRWPAHEFRPPAGSN